MKRSKTIPFLNTGDLTTPSYARIGKSSVFDLVLNAQTEENDFIESDMTTTDVMSYKPELPQELQTNKGDPAFDYVYDLLYNLPTGEDVKQNVLIVFAGDISTSSDTASPIFLAWNTEATLTLDHFDTVAEKIYFNLSFNKITKGYATVTSAGVPTFSETRPS